MYNFASTAGGGAMTLPYKIDRDKDTAAEKLAATLRAPDTANDK